MLVPRQLADGQTWVVRDLPPKMAEHIITPESPLRGMSSENSPDIRIIFWPILVIPIRISRVN